jgi:gamma-glutamylputrescine oxidase
VTTSLWLDEPGPRWPGLAGDVSADVAIVGAGVAGTALSLALARDGARPVVVEARTVAAGASGRNAGFVLAGVAENFVVAGRRYGAERAWRVWRFTRTNRVLLRAQVERCGIDCGLRWRGSLQRAGSDAEWDEIRESARLLAARGVRVRLEEPVRGAVYEEDGELHPVRLVRGLARAAAALGARIHEGTPAISVRRDAVVTDRGTVRAGAVVLCTNAYTERLVPGSRVAPVRGQMLATAPLGRVVFERPTYADRGYRYWRQTEDGRVVVGGWRDLALEEERGEDERTTPTIQAALDAFLAEQGIDAAVTHRWGGIMGFAHDALPYLGRRADGLYACGGFTGHGNAFAFAAADVLAGLIRSGSHPDADLFDPERP